MLHPSIRTAESTSNSKKCASRSARTSPAISLSKKRADEAALWKSVRPRSQSRPWRLTQGTRRSNCVIRALVQKFVTCTPSRKPACFGDHSFRTILCQLGAGSGMAIRSAGRFPLRRSRPIQYPKESYESVLREYHRKFGRMLGRAELFRENYLVCRYVK